MANSLNNIILIGRLGRDAELKYLQNGNPVCNFSIAINENWKTADGEKRENTQWIDCALWGKRAEALNQYLTKGKQVQVRVGFLTTRAYINNAGEPAASIKVTVDDIAFLGGGDNSQFEAAGPDVGDGGSSDEHPF